MREQIRRRLEHSVPPVEPVAEALQGLPGELAARLTGRRFIPAAVLLPLVDTPAGLELVLTRRTAHLRDHAGQISFPGGRVEAADRGPLATALREAAEETGLNAAAVEVVGYLPPHAVVTGFVVTPVVGLVAGQPAWQPDAFEVAEIFQVPLAFFLEPTNRQTGSRRWAGVDFGVSEYHFGEHRIWGATAQIISSFVDIINKNNKL